MFTPFVFLLFSAENNTMKLSNYPLLKILFPFVLGILYGYFGRFSFKMCPKWFSVACIFGLISGILCLVKTYKWQWVKTLMMAAAYFFAGVSAVNFRFSSHLTAEELRLISENQDWVVRVADFPVTRAKTVKLVAQVLCSDQGRHINDRVMLYVQRSFASEVLEYGDILLIHTRLEEFESPKNPDAFDHRRYMHRKGIYHTGYVADGFWHRAGYQPKNRLKSLAHNMQHRMSDTFASAGMSGREQEIVKAILLGDDDTMEPELKAAYAAAGVSHILCVSGMHVGVIFLILNFLLKPLDLFRSTRMLKALLLMLTIWLYAHITGLSPSVTRSATMFTFVTIGQLIQRNTNVFHSLLASLWILLTFNPLLLFELGFQLSYLAVFSIVWFQPLVASVYTGKTKIGGYLWGLVTVSVAAQIGTFPISVYYFGQFPNYFLLSNLSVITLSFVVMMTAVVLLGVSFISVLSRCVSFLLTWEIRIMNGIITFIEGLPGAVTRNIDFSVWQVLLLYAFIMLVFLAIRRRKRRVGWAAYAVFALLAGTFLMRKVELLRQREVVVYEVRKASALSFCNRQESVLFSDSIRGDTCAAYKYAVANHARRQHAACVFVNVDSTRFDCDFLCKRGPWIRFNQKNVYLLRRKEKVYPVAIPVFVDVLILQHNPTQLPDEVAEVLHFQEVVADATNTPFYVRRWENWCRKKGIPFRKGG